MQATNKLLIPKLGPHFLLPFGVIAFSIIIFLWVSTETAFTFALMALPVGLSFGVINPCAIVITVETEQATGQRLLPLHHACFSIGSLFGGLIGGFFASLAFSPLSSFFALMMLGILYGLTCLLPCCWAVFRWRPRPIANRWPQSYLASQLWGFAAQILFP